MTGVGPFLQTIKINKDLKIKIKWEWDFCVFLDLMRKEINWDLIIRQTLILVFFLFVMKELIYDLN